jgi:hypothetical protein
LIRSEEGWAMPRAYSSDLRERVTAAVSYRRFLVTA